MTSFKSEADQQRHHRIVHGKLSQPQGPFICKYKVGETQCGLVFEKKFQLTTHKNRSGHVKRRPRGQDSAHQ